MKGTSFQNGVEYKLHLEGETWSQGDSVSGTVEAVARNAGSTVGQLEVSLAEATERRIKAKSPDAYGEIEKAKAAESPLPFKFTLPLDARITDKAGSIYALYGAEGAAPATLKMNIIPHLHLRDFCDLLSTHFRFAFKAFAAGKKGFTEAKYDPPQAKDWVSLEQLVIQLKMDGEFLFTKFLFDRAEIDPAKPGTQKIKVTREVEREWNLSELIHDFNQRLNKDAAILAVDSVIEEYRQAGWLA